MAPRHLLSVVRLPILFVYLFIQASLTLLRLSGFAHCGAQAQLPWGVWDLGSPTCIPSIGRQILNRWTTREAPSNGFLIGSWPVCHRITKDSGGRKLKQKPEGKKAREWMDPESLWGHRLFLYDGQLLLKSLKMTPPTSQSGKQTHLRLKEEKQGKGWWEVRKTLFWQLNCCSAIFPLLLTLPNKISMPKFFNSPLVVY